jgi:hypothetical protein
MTLNTALSLTYDQLNAVAQSPDYWTILNTAFGANYNQTLAQTLQSQWQAGDFSALPPVEILSSSTLGKANGAYAQSTNKIYLSDSFLATASEDQLVAVLLEEIGHSIDAKINQTDSAGDEGELFSLLVRGLIPSATELNRLQTENDQATIVIDGQLVAIEQAAEPTLVWAKRLGGTGDDQGNSLQVDSSGNVYSTGTFSGTVDFDPGVDVSNLTSAAGSNDVFISKLNSNGDFVWAKRFGGTSVEQGFSLQVDSSGNVYSTGTFQGTVDFDPGVDVSNLTSAGSFDVFISKLNSDGSFAWAKSFGGTGSEQGNSLQVDSSGNVYSTGFFSGTADFDPGAEVSNLTSAGSGDVFISKLNSNGDFVWAKSVGGTGLEQGRSLQVDSSGNVYSTGFFQGTVDFDPGASVSNLTSAAGSFDVFISKLNSNGDLVWAKSFGGTGSDSGSSLQVDSSGNVYSTGSFQGTVDFNPDGGVSNLTSAGSDDVFISKLNSNGDLVWAKSFGGTGSDWGSSLQVDSSGNVYSTGSFQGTVDFNPDGGVSNLTSAGSGDVFISKLNSDGSFAWAKSVGGTSNDRVSSLQVDSSGNLYSTGNFNGTADFDPGAEVSNLTSAGLGDVFIIKLAPPVTNQAPTDLSLSANTIAENTVIGAGVKIGNITITDPDATGNNNLLTVEGTDAANFEIRNSTELFFIGTSPDFETKPSYTISLKSTDGALTYSEAFTVNVTDVKPKVTISPGTTPVEGGAIGTYTITLLGRQDS